MMTLVRNTTWLIFLLLGPLLLIAQKDFHFENYTTRNGLSHNEIRTILRDKQGFLWLGTGNGLNRFDGREFKVYLPNPKVKNALQGASITGLGEDPQGRIWVTNNKGIDIYNPLTGDFSKLDLISEAALDHSFRVGCFITFDHTGRAIITSGHHNILIIEPDGKQRIITTPEVPKEDRPLELKHQKGNKVYITIPKSKEEVWLSSDHGLFSLRLKDDHFTHYPLKGCTWNFGPGSMYYEKAKERVWMTAFGSGFFYLDVRTGIWGKLRKEIYIQDYISAGQSMAAFGADYLFLNTPGLYNLKTGSFFFAKHIPDDPYSFPTGTALCAYTDREGILWIGTTVGLVKLDPHLQGFKHVFLEAHPVFDYDNSVFDIFFEPKDKKFYASSFYCGGVYAYDPISKSSEDITSKLPAPLRGTCKILRDSKGKTWITANGTLYEADFVNHRFTPARSAPPPKGVRLDPVVPDMEEDADGNIWLAKWGVGPLIYDRKANILSHVEGDRYADEPNRAYMLCADRARKHIWMCTAGNGIWTYDIKTRKATSIVELKDKDGALVSLNDASGIECDFEDKIWVSTRLGLVAIDANKKALVLTEVNGLANSQIEGLGKDLKGRLWLATASGISMVDPRTLEVRNFDERHGLKLDATLDAFSVLPSGEVCSGTKRGFIIFHPDSVLQYGSALKPIITNFRLEGRTWKEAGQVGNWREKIVLKPSQNIFSIEYAAPNFTLSEDTRFSYYLEGLDKTWSEPQQNKEVTFTSVPPGTYKFCLKARNKDGIWSKQITTLDIVIKPPFWQTPWFIALINLIIGGLIYGAYRLRTWQIRKEERMKAEFNKRLAEVEMAALRSQMNPHFLFNCLNSINRFIQRNEPDTASAYLTKFSRLIRLVLDNSRSNLVTLRDELEALRLYLELEAMRFVNRFTYHINISPDLDITCLEIPPMIIQPYVENAIWHGLMHKEAKPGEECHLEVRVFPEGNTLVVEVEDNGVGRNMARALKSKSATAQKSHGMAVTAERIQMINQIYQTEASIIIEDLYTPEGKAAGTKVRLTLPLE
ncbi:MAG TPA: histidine kinase [Haliscomenobacter sp.]|uniref:ligand-binding sensor domain-containing protein n=1 Tax=Haliscomenobacter sp. TaxID=2717303 RepID=UPI002BA7D97A|nr:histidine kinase [Haliscomenobacter sp.]HOY19705.1 histidine kinase [Haliscomenobacter sp.]